MRGRANILNSLTSYNLVIGVLSMFFLLTKTPMHLLRVFYPPLSVAVHAVLIALYVISVRFQAGSDMSDPAHPQPGPPWYITKNCNVAAHQENIGYCKQAKSLFAVDIIIMYALPVLRSAMNHLLILYQFHLLRPVCPGCDFLLRDESRT